MSTTCSSVCPGIQLDWNRTEGLEDALGRDGVSSNYRFDLAPRTWDFIRPLRSGTAVFTVPSGAIKCAGAPQKIAYLASDYWRKQGVLNDIDVHLVMPGPRPFGVPAIADSLDKVIAHYGIHLHTNSELTSVDAAATRSGSPASARVEPTPCCRTTFSTPCRGSRLRTGSSPARCRPATQTDTSTSTSPPCSTCGSRMCSASATPARRRTPTGAAIRRAGPRRRRRRRRLPEERTAARVLTATRRPDHHLVACDVARRVRYVLELEPTFPLLDPTSPLGVLVLKKYGLPFMYWNLMLKGLA